jgi:hypothetical protein
VSPSDVTRAAIECVTERVAVATIPRRWTDEAGEALGAFTRQKVVAITDVRTVR